MSKIINIIEPSECPDIEILKAYAKGQMSDNEHHKVEHHLVDCPMCEAEVEGLLSMKNHDELDSHIQDINKNIDAKIQKKSHFNLYKFKIAALIVVLLAVGIVAKNIIFDSENTASLQDDNSQILLSSNTGTPHKETPKIPANLIDKQQFNHAVKLYEANDKSAEALFDKIIKKRNKYMYDALWYRAVLYEKSGDTTKALEYFKKVAESNSKFKQEAELRVKGN